MRLLEIQLNCLNFSYSYVRFSWLSKGTTTSVESPNVHAVTNLLHFLDFQSLSHFFFLLSSTHQKIPRPELISWIWPDNDHEMNFNMKDDHVKCIDFLLSFSIKCQFKTKYSFQFLIWILFHYLCLLLFKCNMILFVLVMHDSFQLFFVSEE